MTSEQRREARYRRRQTRRQAKRKARSDALGPIEEVFQLPRHVFLWPEMLQRREVESQHTAV